MRFGSVFAFTVLALQVPASLAQTPIASDGPHPAHIHAGTCDEPGEVVVPLERLAAPSTVAPVGAATAHPVKTSRNVIDMSLEEILAGEFAVNIHKSDEEIDVYIARGDTGGIPETDDGGRTHLIFGLGELNDSGLSGIVWLGEDGDQTELVITLIEPKGMD